MIDEIKTFEKFGYYSSDWAPKSHKKIVAICNNCRKERIIEKADYVNKCRSCVHLGHIVTNETRQKLREANLGKEITEEEKQRLRTLAVGNKHTDEAKLKIGNSHRGKKLSDEQKDKLRKANVGKKISEETRKKLSKVNSGKNNNMYGRTGEKSPHWKGGERVSSRKYRAKRRAMLDPDPIELNKDFIGSQGHHVNEKYVINIPAELHKSIGHKQTNGMGMNKINKCAFKYLLDNKEDMIISEETAFYINLMCL